MVTKLNNYILDDLVVENNNYKWSKSVGKFIYIIYRNNKYKLEIIEYLTNKRLVLKYGDDLIFSYQTKQIIRDNIPIALTDKINPYQHTIYTTHPWCLKYISEDVAKMYNSGSLDIISIKCDLCGHEKFISVKSFVGYKVSCPVCSDKYSSFPEKLMSRLLYVLDVKFKREVSGKIFEWIGKYKYDFYLEDYKIFIELDGEDHVSDRRGNLKNRIENDKIKDLLCINNGFKLIRIDCVKAGEIKYLKQNFIEGLKCIIKIENSHFNKALELCENNRFYDLCKFWSENKTLTTTDLSEIYGLSKNAIKESLIRGSKIWDWCNYTVELGRNLGKIKSATGITLAKSKPIDVYKDGEYINSYQSALYLSKVSEVELGIKLLSAKISAVANGDRITHKGYTFKYSDKPIEYFLENKVGDSHES